MTWAWEQDLRMGPKLVLLALADHSDGNGVCWPGHELIAEKCGISRQTVTEHLNALEALGLVSPERTRSGGRAGKVRYFLRMTGKPGPVEAPKAGPANVVNSDIERTRESAPPMSGKPTLKNRPNVGVSGVPMSEFPVANKEEPRAIEPKTSPNPPQAGVLLAVTGEALRRWFEAEFWPRYPKRVGKADALVQLDRMHPDAQLLAEIIQGLDHRMVAERHAKARNAFFPAWPDPHRYLRKRRWLDLFEVPRETTGVPLCHCGAVAVTGDGRRHYCAEHDPDRGQA